MVTRTENSLHAVCSDSADVCILFWRIWKGHSTVSLAASQYSDYGANGDAVRLLQSGSRDFSSRNVPIKQVSCVT